MSDRWLCDDCGSEQIELCYPAWFKRNEKGNLEYVEIDTGAEEPNGFCCHECDGLSGFKLTRDVRAFESSWRKDGTSSDADCTEVLFASVETKLLLYNPTGKDGDWKLSRPAREAIQECLSKVWDWEDDTVRLRYRIVSSVLDKPIEMEAVRR